MGPTETDYRPPRSVSAPDAAQAPPGPRPADAVAGRPRVAGKFLWSGNEKLIARGVTYGTFRPDGTGAEFNDHEKVAADFEQMAACGINAVRVYTPPPEWLLDLAWGHRLRVMAGLPWEQHVAFLDDAGRPRSIERRVREAIRPIAGHPALLAYAVGNEIPSGVVRWHGKRRVQRFIERLVDVAKDEDPDGLVTYVNFPSTEYLELPRVDFLSFNVYLESKLALDAYLARLHNLAGERPLVMAEIGLDSRRNGEQAQAATLAWQLDAVFGAGCAGAFVFSWTDEWHRGGHEIDDWDFGLTTRDRAPKPALAAVRSAFSAATQPGDHVSPRISVCVCSFNGGATVGECLSAATRLDYPDYEVIVVDDGSSDDTARVAEGYDVRVIRTPNQGLSSARNTAIEAAEGEIVAFLDDDAHPDPDWLTHLAYTFQTTDYAAVGGPNLTPPGADPIAQCVGHAPGGPQHVLISDRDAEHIPGCNMAFRKSELRAIGGFDPRFRAAGDDVDVCWRLLDAGRKIGFNAAAMVWHHPRGSIRAFWRQQRGYGHAEALLERKWPDRYSATGNIGWSGRIYGAGANPPWGGWRVYYGRWGSGLFQSIYQPAYGGVSSLAQMPEWYLLVAALCGLSALGFLWAPMLLAVPLACAAIAAAVLPAAWAAAGTEFCALGGSRLRRAWLRTVLALLHVIQPLARLRGRLSSGLTPWRRATTRRRWGLPISRTVTQWSEQWHSPEERLHSLQERLAAEGAAVRAGDDFDRWDLHIVRGLVGGARLRLVVEEHGAGRQLARYRIAPAPSVPSVILVGVLTLLAVVAWVSDDTPDAVFVLAGAAALVLAAGARACGTAVATLRHALIATEARSPAALPLEPAPRLDPGSEPVTAGTVTAMVSAAPLAPERRR